MSSWSPQSAKAPRPERPVPPGRDEIARLTERAGVVIGIATGILGCLLAAGFAFLPVGTLTEKACVFIACLAASVGSVSGIGAWRDARRFSLTATCVFVTVACLAGLSAEAENDHPVAVTQGAAAGAESSSQSPAAELTQSPAARPSSALTSPMASHAANSVAASAAAPQFLANMTPVDPAQSNYATGQQKVDGQVDPQAIYDQTTDDYSCNDGSSTGQVVYELDRKYGKFHAVVGLADTSPSGDTETFKVFVDGQQRYASTALTVGEKQAINLSITGAFRITLEDTCASQTMYSGGPSITAAWTDAEVSN
jgi:hypothetical protein